MSRGKLLICAFLFIALGATGLFAQNKTGEPLAVDPEPVSEEQDSLKVFVNEVRIPITAYDENGRFDPTVELDDLMVKEDGVLQPLKSIYRIPASVLLLLDTGGELNPAKNVSLTREIAITLVSSLKTEGQLSVIQINNRVELVQDWTKEKSEVIQSLNGKLMSGKRTVLARGIAAAVEKLEKTPVGNRHLILISDGIDSQSDRAELPQALQRLIGANITTHVLSYTSLGLMAKKPPLSRPRLKSAVPEEVIMTLPRMKMPNDERPDLRDILERKGGVVIDLDRLLRRGTRLKEELERREKALGHLAEETGGGFWVPLSAEGMIQQAVAVAQEVDSQYLVTYALKRSVNTAAGESLKIDVISRRIGLKIRARRSYLAKSTDTTSSDSPPSPTPR
jgi:VWFA-related protein